MDGRRALGWAGAMLGSLLGCSSPMTRSDNRPEQMIANAKAGQPMAKQEIEFNAPGTGTVKPTTAYAIGQMGEKMALDPARSPDEQEALRVQARQSYMLAADLDPKYADAHIALAKSFDAAGDHEHALATFKKAVGLVPNSGPLWYEYSTAQAKSRDWAGAVESISRAAKLEPENRQYGKTLGLMLARAGRNDEALTQLMKCMGEAEAHYQLARMQQHLQQPQLCQQQLRLALKCDPKYSPAREMLNELTQPTESAGAVQAVKYEEPARSSALPQLPPVLIGGVDRTAAPAKPGARVDVAGIE